MKKFLIILFYIITLPIFSKDFLVYKSSFSEKQIDEINNIVSKKFESYIEKGVASKADIIQSENKLLIILGGGGFGLALLILFYLSSKIDSKFDKLDSKIDEGLNKLNNKIDEGLKETDKKIEKLDSKIDDGLKETNKKIERLDSKIDEGLKETNKKIERLDSKIDDGLNKIYDILLKDRNK